jgi:hypothetical protein
LLLDDLAKLLELRIMSEEIQVAEISTALSCCCGCGGSRSITATISSTTTATSLSSKIKKIDTSIIIAAFVGGRRGLAWCRCGGLASLLFLLDAFGDTLFRSIRVTSLAVPSP